MSRTRVQDAKMEGELLALTYGAIVARIMKDTERCEEANNQVSILKNWTLSHNVSSLTKWDTTLESGSSRISWPSLETLDVKIWKKLQKCFVKLSGRSYFG